MLLHPEIPSCEDCRRWLYDDKWQKSGRGEGERRPPGSPLPCRYPKKCPKSWDGSGPHPEKELCEQNYEALEYSYQCAADPGGSLPRDGTTIGNNGTIQMVMDSVKREQQADVAGLMTILAAIGGTRRK